VQRRFTLDELAHFDGREGRPAYVACDGVVYDVSESFLWKEGRHWATHQAGTDLTSELANAPHGQDLLSRVAVIGYVTS
jgi:predicted heme/steroid binding protein